jgi:hypothetical protein
MVCYALIAVLRMTIRSNNQNHVYHIERHSEHDDHKSAWYNCSYFILYPIRVRSLHMPRRSKKPLKGAVTKIAAPSLEAAREGAAKITSKCRCFANRAEAARKVLDGALLATEFPTAMQRMRTEYEAVIANLHNQSTPCSEQGVGRYMVIL